LNYPSISSKVALDTDGLQQLSEQPWHGDIRELRNGAEHAVVPARRRPLHMHDFPPPQPHKNHSDAAEPLTVLKGIVIAIG